MNLFLAGQDPSPIETQKNIRAELRPAILESFMQVNGETTAMLSCYDKYLLDSGAFTFLNSGKGLSNTDLLKYIDRYITYVNQNNIDLFFEMDIDSIIGYQKVLDLRKHINAETGKTCIPVWHKSRGINAFKEMCQTYPYVAIGGYVSGEFSKKEIANFPKLISYAHQQGAKIHGLGFTALKALTKCHFDSVDSTAWLSGNRFGHVYKFDGKTMVKVSRPPGTRVKYKETAINNFKEWVKFSKWAETHL